MFAALLISTAIFSPVAYADTVRGEVKLSDVGPSNAQNEEEYSIKYTGNIDSKFSYSVEFNTVHEATTKSNIIGGIEYNLPSVEGFKPVVFGELGQSFSNRGYTYWGTGIKISKPLIGPVSLAIGYRHREGFDQINKIENRLNGGLRFRLSEDWTTEVQYYRTTGTTRRDQVGVSLSKKL